MEPAIILLAIFSVPLTAIVSSTWLKAKKLQLEHGGSEQIKRLEQQNADLRRRMEVLESIAIDSRALGHLEQRQISPPMQEERRSPNDDGPRQLPARTE
jgi:hypothetical protein